MVDVTLRLYYNLKIMKWLRENLTVTNLRKAGYAKDCGDFANSFEFLISEIKAHSNLRFIQLLWLENLDDKSRDRFYEESEDTYKYLINTQIAQSVRADAL